MLLHRKLYQRPKYANVRRWEKNHNNSAKNFRIPICVPIITMNINNNKNNNNNPAKIQIIFPNPNMGPHDGAQRTQKSGRRYSSECPSKNYFYLNDISAHHEIIFTLIISTKSYHGFFNVTKKQFLQESQPKATQKQRQ